MTLYDFTSTLLTVIGYSVFVYQIMFELQPAKVKKSKLGKLLIQYLNFAIFLKLEYFLLGAIQNLPFVTLFLLVYKVYFFFPENAISLTVVVLVKMTGNIAAYIDSKQIKEVERHILDIIKTLEYKKAAIKMRHQAAASKINEDLNSSKFSNSMEKESVSKQPHKIIKSEIGNRMTKILDDLGVGLRLNAEQMIIKPNEATGQQAKYEDVEIDYFLKTSRITFTNKLKPFESKTLMEIKWITKDMMSIEVAFKKGGSRSLS